MKKVSDLVSLDLILTTIQKLSNKYEELEGIADTQLNVEYSKGWYKDFYAAKNKLEVLNELSIALKKAAKEGIPIPERSNLFRKQYYVVYYHDDIVAVVNPDTVEHIEVPDYQPDCVKLVSKVYYREYDWIDASLVRFIGTYVKKCDVDIQTIKNTMRDTIIWDNCPIVDSFDQALEIAQTITDSWRKIKAKYNK